MSYTVITEPSGNRLDTLNEIIYTDTDISHCPVHTNVYNLINSSGRVVSDNFVPYAAPQGLPVPGLLQCDASNNIYVANYLGSVCIYDPINFDLLAININNSNVNNIPPNSVRDMDFDLSGVIYISTAYKAKTGISSTYKNTSQIYTLNRETTYTGFLHPFTINDVSLNNIAGIVFDNNGNLYIADNGNNCIVKVVVKTQPTFNNAGNGTGSIYVPYFAGLNGPSDLIFDRLGNLYIANTNENNIIQISYDGLAIMVFASGLNVPISLRFDHLEILYVTNYGTYGTDGTDGIPGYICTIINNDTNATSTITNFNTEYNFTDINHPTGITFDNSNNLYIVNSSNATSLYTNPNTSVNYILEIVSNYIDASNNEWPLNVNSTQIAAMTMNTISKELYISTYSISAGLPAYKYTNTKPPNYNGAIYKSTTGSNNATLYYPTPLLNPADPSLNNPTAIVFNSSGDHLYVANASSNNIVVITNGGTNGYILQIDNPEVSLNSPSGLVFDTSHLLYVSNYIGNNIIQLSISISGSGTIFDASGIILTNSNTTNDVSLNRPCGITFDTFGNLYIANSGNNNIVQVSNIVSTSTTCTGSFAVYNQPNIFINNPYALAFNSSGILYVSNSNDKIICIITNNGIVSEFNYNPILNPLVNPTSLVFDASNNLFICNVNDEYETLSSTITPLNYVYKLLNEATETNLFDSSIDAFTSAYYSTVDNSGNIYVVSNNNTTIYKLELNNHITVFSTFIGTVVACAFDTSVPQTLYILHKGGLVETIPITGGSPTTFNISGGSIASPKDITFDLNNNFYIAEYNIVGTGTIIKVIVTGLHNGTVDSTFNVTLTAPYRLVVDNTGQYLYVGCDTLNDPTNNYIYQVDLSVTSPTPTQYVKVPLGYPITLPQVLFNFSVTGLCVDSNNYLYVVQYNYDVTPSINYKTILYRTSYPVPTPEPTQFLSVLDKNINYEYHVNSMKYSLTENSLILCEIGENNIEKYYLSYFFNGLSLGPYDNTLTINEAYLNDPYLDASSIIIFNVYDYTVVDPSFIQVNTPNSISIHFINPIVNPNPTHTYVLTHNSNPVSNPMINNAAIIGPKQTPGSTYPTGVVYDSNNSQIYFPVQNNSLSLVNVTYNTTGDDYTLFNNYVTSTGGLGGPTNIVVDSSNNVYILNTKPPTPTTTTTEQYITQVQTAGGQVIVNNTFYTGITSPICLTIDSSTNYLYLLSGTNPTYTITQIPLIVDISNSTIIADLPNTTILHLPLGTLYNPFSMTVCKYVPGYISNDLSIDVNSLYPYTLDHNYLYIGQGQFKNTKNQILPNQIIAIDLTSGIDPSLNYYKVVTSSNTNNLTYPPRFLANKQNGYLYACDLSSNTISKISTTPYLPNIEPYMSTCIYAPSGLSFDSSGVLYINSCGINPNNNKITKVYDDFFEFFNVDITTTGTVLLNIYDMTTKSYVMDMYGNEVEISLDVLL